MTDILRHTPAETAKIIRADLKAAFPGMKFKVRSERHWNGSSVRVSWTLGPSRQEIHDLVGRYATEDGFDGGDNYLPAKPIEIETPDGPRLARFVRFIGVHRHQEVSPTS